MTIQEGDLRRITETMWSTTFGLELTALPGVPPEEAEPVLTAFVLIAGSWDGAVMIQCPTNLARRCAALMFELSPEAVTGGEIDDALGELANMAGGNIKSLVEGACTLSLPGVIAGRDHSVKVPGSRVLQRLAFASEGDLVVVSIRGREMTSEEPRG